MSYGRRPQAGFSLIELLTVLAVLSVVTTVGTMAFHRITTVWRADAMHIELKNLSANIFEQMRRDFDSVLPARLSGVPVLGEKRLNEQHRYNGVRLEDDRIIIPIEYEDPHAGRMRASSVMYHIDRSGPLPVLVRTLGPLGAQPPEGARVEVAEGVLTLRCRYLQNGRYSDTWTGSGLPEAVEANLVLHHPDRPWIQIARKAEFFIHVE